MARYKYLVGEDYDNLKRVSFRDFLASIAYNSAQEEAYFAQAYPNKSYEFGLAAESYMRDVLETKGRLEFEINTFVYIREEIKQCSI